MTVDAAVALVAVQVAADADDAAHRERVETRSKLAGTVRAAAEAGVPKRQIAIAARVSRQQVYLWIGAPPVAD